MPESLRKSLFSTPSTLFYISFLVLISVALAFVIVINSFTTVEKFVVEDIRGNIQTIERYSELRRAFDSVDSDTHKIIVSALRKPDVFKKNSQNIIKQINLIHQKDKLGGHIFEVTKGHDLIDSFLKDTENYFNNFSQLNTILLQLESINWDFIDDLTSMEKEIGTLLVDYARNKKDSSALRQLFDLIPFCQQYNMQTQLLVDVSISRKDTLVLGIGKEHTKTPEKNALNTIKVLKQTLYTMTSAEPPVDGLVYALLVKVDQYQELVKQLDIGLKLFLKNYDRLQITRQEIAEVLVELEKNSSETIQETEKDTKRLLSETTKVILTISLIVLSISIVGWFLIRFIALQMEKSSKDLLTAKEGLEQTNKQLNEEIKVRKRTEAELQKSINQLLHAEKLSAIGSLSASIAHEFNNPLYAVMTVLGGILKRATLSDEDNHLLNGALSECNRMKNLIKDLQDFNRPTSGKMSLMDIHLVIDSILLLGKKDLKINRITIEKSFVPNMPKITAISDQIKQVLLNLIRNAVDSCEGGGIIKIDTDFNENKAVIRIQDSGKGINPEDKAHIFEPFFTTKPAVKGTGLGLSVSYGIIKKHKGTIAVESKPGEGAIFTITLPIEGKLDEA